MPHRQPAAGLAPLLAALLLVGCGGLAKEATSTPCSPTPPPTVTPAAAVVGPASVRADRGRVDAGESVTFAVHVAGPARLVTDCTATVELLVIDSADIHVFASHTAAQRGTPCGNVTLTATQALDYELEWSPDPTLPSGRYTAALTVGDLATVTLGVTLGRRPLEPC